MNKLGAAVGVAATALIIPFTAVTASASEPVVTVAAEQLAPPVLPAQPAPPVLPAQPAPPVLPAPNPSPSPGSGIPLERVPTCYVTGTGEGYSCGPFFNEKSCQEFLVGQQGSLAATHREECVLYGNVYSYTATRI